MCEAFRDGKEWKNLHLENPSNEENQEERAREKQSISLWFQTIEHESEQNPESKKENFGLANGDGCIISRYFLFSLLEASCYLYKFRIQFVFAMNFF